MLPLPLTLLAAAASGGEFFEPVEQASALAARPLLAKDLTRSRKATTEDAAESQDWRQIHISKGAGLEVRQSFTLGEREVVFGLKGPLVKKRLGVVFEVRF